ncbi:WS/DGAT domain-containing protein [Algiphilus sp.]|uniref:WS/DGAT domain-containing protein n=1 Tax=Algiphilus sp. TaxID=1872431 RepID=UPI003B515D90
MSAPVAETRLQGVDRAWLEMDTPHQPMVISAVLEFAAGVEPDALLHRFVDTLMRYPRFRQRADDHHSPARWVNAGALDWAYHVHVQRRALGKGAMREAVAQALGLGLDRERPLWRITLFRRRGGGATLLFQVHHALADGIALMHLLMQNVDGANGDSRPPSLAARSHGGPLGRVIDRMQVVNHALSGIAAIWKEDLHHPQHIVEQFHQGRQTLATAARILTLPDDNPDCLLAGTLSGRRVLAWENSVALEQVRRQAQAAGVKINDVLLSALAAAFGRYVECSDGRLDAAQNLRVSIPVNLRPADDPQLGNCFGLVLLDLPIGERDPRRRLRRVSERMQALKTSGEARVILGGLAAAGHMPVAAEQRIVGMLSAKAAAVVSNLPGPKQAVRFAGSTVENLAFWPPQAGGIGIGVSLLSYAGRIRIGVSSDIAAMRNPQIVVDAFQRSLKKPLAKEKALST